MQRKLTLAKNSYLWEEGDQARNIAIVEKGKLAVRTADGIVGVVLPKMVVGEGPFGPSLFGISAAAPASRACALNRLRLTGCIPKLLAMSISLIGSASASCVAITRSVPRSSQA